MSESRRQVNKTGMPEVAYRVLFDVAFDIDRQEVMLFSEMLNPFRSLDVLWDMVIMSHGQGKGHQHARAVEVILYHDDAGNYENAKTTLTDFLKSDNIPYRFLSDVTD
jgi:hypothetical protein